MYIEENIKFLRGLNHLSQRTFDRIIFPFYSADTYVTYKLENNKYQNPLPFVITIVNHFHISLDKFMYTVITENDINAVYAVRNSDYFYSNFNNIRKSQNIPLKLIAQKSDIPLNTIINYSRKNNYRIIKLENLCTISYVLGCSLDDLLSNPADDIIPN